jgi:hypothetical protein
VTRQHEFESRAPTVRNTPFAVRMPPTADHDAAHFARAVSWSMLRTAITLAVGAVALGATTATAQCRPPRNSHEARLLAFYSVPLVFTADPGAIGESPARLRISLEGAYVPTASATLQHTDFCYTGRAEHTGLTSFFGRPRVAIALPANTGIELSYLPPITVADATPSLFGAGAWITRRVTSAVDLTARAHVTAGTVRGPITCPSDALQQSDANAPCYGTSPSRDEFRPRIYGGELIASLAPAGARARWFGGVGVNALAPRFRVGFSDLLGGTDHTTIAVNLVRATALGGLAIRATSRCDVSAEGFASFGDGATVRAIVGCAAIP